MVIRPTTGALAEHLASAARWVGEILARGGRRGWIVGGTVRDLALGGAPKDVDMASAAAPDEIERLFPRAIGVGRAFGTMIVVTPSADIELTTFRSESGYGDARRPDVVHYGSSVEEDAKRRDFTCNALYLDPLTDDLRDPAGGMADLERGLLRTVGVARERFAEDGLRLLRMARFEAGLDLAPAEGLHEAARATRAALRGVSPERVHGELARMLARPRSARALGVLEACGLLELALPRWHERAHGSRPREEVWAARMRVLAHLADPPGVELGLAVLLEVDPLGPGGRAAEEEGVALADALRLSRSERDACIALWTGRRRFAEIAEGAGAARGSRAARIRALRAPLGGESLALARAWALAQGRAREPYDALEQWAGALAPEDLAPAPWITAADLARTGIDRGPRWGELLREAEDRQLEGELDSRDAALRWLAARARELGG